MVLLGSRKVKTAVADGNKLSKIAGALLSIP
jgi:hypothetical protein